MAMLATYALKHAIVRETRASGETETREEELKPAGFLVILRRPKAKDLRAFDRHGEALMAATEEMLTRISQLSTEEVAELDAEDFGELGNLLGGPPASGLPTGATSSAD